MYIPICINCNDSAAGIHLSGIEYSIKVAGSPVDLDTGVINSALYASVGRKLITNTSTLALEHNIGSLINNDWLCAAIKGPKAYINIFLIGAHFL